MNLPRPISRYKTTIYILLAMLLATSCGVQQKSSSSQQRNPSIQAKNIGTQQTFSIRENNPKPLAAIQPESSQQSIPSAQVNDIEKKLGITIQKNDPDMPLYIEAAKWIGVRYKYSGTGESGVDCSGLTCLLYKVVYKKTLHRSSADMAKHDIKGISKDSMKPGDLIFFATSGNTKAITHVGVYLKESRFIHASSRVGVVVNNLNEDYYRKIFVKCGRVE